MLKRVLLGLAAFLIIAWSAGPALAYYSYYLEGGGGYQDYIPPTDNVSAPNSSSSDDSGFGGGRSGGGGAGRSWPDPVSTYEITVYTGSYTYSEVVDSWTESSSWREGYTSSYQSYDTPKEIVGVWYVGKSKITDYAWNRNTYRYESWTDVYETINYTKYAYTTVTNYDIYQRTVWSDGTITDSYLTSYSVVGPTSYSVFSTPYITRIPQSSSALVSSTRLTDTVVEAVSPTVSYKLVDGEWIGPTEVAGTETSYQDSIRNLNSTYFTEKSASWTEQRSWSDERWSYSQPVTYWMELTYRYDTWEVWRTYYYTTRYQTPWYKTHTQIAVYSWPSGYSEEQVVAGWRDSYPYKWTTSSSTTSSTNFLRQDGTKNLVDGKVVSQDGLLTKTSLSGKMSYKLVE